VLLGSPLLLLGSPLLLLCASFAVYISKLWAVSYGLFCDIDSVRLIFKL
jgi:hypothetical protein